MYFNSTVVVYAVITMEENISKENIEGYRYDCESVCGYLL